ncbi:hypothetical protein OsccyDRAFT_2830 [Leptolyngbyaceae cyanobacterium JSC-12]|nr:hypothetical protein OsccyDRAFT_2830 [Leptolyngbyaceae cyanobacterium JSC-12]
MKPGMKRNQLLIWSLTILSMVVIVLISHSHTFPFLPAIAQTSKPSPISPPSSPPGSPSPASSPTPFPPVPVTPSALPSPLAPPASDATPLPLGGTYQDSARRFKVGVLENYKVSPLAGSVLIESPDGSLAYTVVPQSQPLGNPIGLIAGYDNSESLAKIATTVFQRGEGFQPTPARPEAGGGAVMDWTGTLTIGGNAQPVRGVILVRPSAQTILLLLIAATQAGQDQIPGALSALATSLEAIQ